MTKKNKKKKTKKTKKKNTKKNKKKKKKNKEDEEGGICVLSPCSMEPQHYFGTALKGMTCFHLTILRHQNIKMSISKLNKNDWVLPFLFFECLSE